MRVPLRRRGRIQVYVSSPWILGDYATSLFRFPKFSIDLGTGRDLWVDPTRIPRWAYVSNWVRRDTNQASPRRFLAQRRRPNAASGLFVSVAAEFQARTGRGAISATFSVTGGSTWATNKSVALAMSPLNAPQTFSDRPSRTVWRNPPLLLFAWSQTVLANWADVRIFVQIPRSLIRLVPKLRMLPASSNWRAPTRLS